MNREENVNRQTDFQLPYRLSREYIYFHFFFKNLKEVFNFYIKEGDSIFDIGCGNKPYEAYIRKITGKTSKYRGCDIVQSSKQKVDIVCEATHITEQSESYDVVLCTQVIEHVFEHHKIFEEAYRLLKPGGLFIVSSALVWQLHEEPYDFYRFTLYGFRELLTAAGFAIKYGKHSGGQWAAFGQMFLHIASISFRNKILRKLFNFLCIPMILFCNLFFTWLDKKVNDAHFTLNYVFVGQKL
jgi:SAM-dependent methyltransferase